ncbi:hypothetical protein [Umezawaea beigongshangensis]|uniref:hypothetical protein n=1 Tax=Umezawaea beigongshangensis TaxID=2780383 RepID=UPI0018F179B1|nr:hypothetical protein [Umezawaea beigongshangensis]
MDRRSVVGALRAAGVADRLYVVEGVHEQVPVPPDFYFLRPGGPGWEVGVYERGRYEVIDRLADEGDACASFYRHLVRRPAGR